MTRYDIQWILNIIDICLLIFLLYQFHFRDKINLFSKFQSSFNEYINKTTGKTIVIKSDIVQLDNLYCTYISNIIFQHSKLELIGNWVFNATNIKSIKIPSSVKMIGENAFYECSSLQTVEFEKKFIIKNNWI